MAEDVTAGEGRKDEVGHSGIYPATGPYPQGDAEINRDDPRTISRESGLDSETEEPENDALGG